MFVDDGSLALLALILVAVIWTAVKLLTLPPLLGGALLLVGCLAILLQSVRRAHARPIGSPGDHERQAVAAKCAHPEYRAAIDRRQADRRRDGTNMGLWIVAQIRPQVDERIDIAYGDILSLPQGALEPVSRDGWRLLHRRR